MSRENGGAGRARRGPSHASLAFALLVLTHGGCSQSEQPPESDFTVLFEAAPEVEVGEDPVLPDPEVWQTPLGDAALERGRQVWTGTCIQCHSTGLGGAPLIGNRELWEPRVAKGIEELVAHATNGFYGDVGEMPARGGNMDLSDEEVRLAVRFMASRVDPSI